MFSCHEISEEDMCDVEKDNKYRKQNSGLWNIVKYSQNL